MFQLLKLRNLVPTLLILACSYIFISLSVEASTLSGPAAGVLAEDTLPTQPPLIQLAITNGSGNAELSWTDSLGAAEYQVHRSTNPFFTPNAGTLLTTVPANTHSYVDTTSGIGDINTNHFYLLTATGGNSNHVGEMDYPIKNTTGAYSMIGIPFLAPSPANASELANQLGNVSNIYRWNASINSFQVFTPPDINDFPLTQGEAIFVQVGSGVPASANIAGTVNVSSLFLHAGNYSFVAMPLQCDELTNASATAADIDENDVINLLQWNRNLQFFTTFTPPDIGDDFVITLGAPFIVQLSASGSTTWPGAQDICK